MALMNLMGSVEQGEDFFMHSLNVCTLSMMVGQEFKLGEDQTRVARNGSAVS